MDDTNRLLRERLRRLIEENIRLEQRLIQLGSAESDRLRQATSRMESLERADFERERTASVLSQLELIRSSNDPVYNFRSNIVDYPASSITDRQRQDVLLRELAPTLEIDDRIDRYDVFHDLRRQRELEERLRSLERSVQMGGRIQQRESTLPRPTGDFRRESLFPRLSSTLTDQASLISRIPYAAAASMPEERSASVPSSGWQPHNLNTKAEEGVVPVALDSDGDFLTKYQVILRQCLEFFTAQEKDVETSVQGRKHKLQVGQIGLRCRFCCNLPIYQRGRGSVHFVKNIQKIYQAAQNMSSTHFISSCSRIPKDLRDRLIALRGIREMGKVGNIYWMDSCRDMGIVEHNGALFWRQDEGRLWTKQNAAVASSPATVASQAIAASQATVASTDSDKSDQEDKRSDNEGKAIGRKKLDADL